ncbi:MAG: transglutaminase domain-containing protein [Eubacteriales bacterium]|nr:transglutaminase domain-containing protein [Eubacteriales bacterium]
MKKNKNWKWLSWILIMILLATAAPVWGYEFSQDTEEEIETIWEVIHENPLCGGEGTRIVEKEIPKSDTDAKTDTPSVYRSGGVPYFKTIEAAAGYFRKCMTNRVNEISLAVDTTDEQVIDDITSIYQKALTYEANGKANEGDYLRFNYGYIYCADTRVNSDTKVRWTLNYTVYYYTTLEQEKELEQRIHQVLNELHVQSLGEYDRIKAIYDYICQNVEYDRGSYPNYSGENVRNPNASPHISLETYMASKGLFTAYNAMIKKKAVCQGYAALLYRMLTECGVQNRIILGTSYGEAHAWNLVRMGNLYYNADSTWDRQETSYAYFMKPQNEFLNHIRNSTVKGNQMDYTSESFQNEFPTAGATSLPVSQITLASDKNVYAYTGKAIKPQVEVPGLTEGIDYKITYKDNVKPGTMSILVEGIDSCLGRKTIYCRIYQMPALEIPANLRQINQTTSAIRLAWEEVENATGYLIYRYDTAQKKYVRCAKVKGNQYVFKGTGIKPGTAYQFVVLPYYQKTIVYEGKKNVLISYGGKSKSAAVVTRPSAPVLTSVKKSGSSLYAVWKRLSACTGYQVQISTSSKFSSNTTRSILVQKNTIVQQKISALNGKKLKKNTRYYIRVRAYKKSGNVRYTGAWSKVISVIYR